MEHFISILGQMQWGGLAGSDLVLLLGASLNIEPRIWDVDVQVVRSAYTD